MITKQDDIAESKAFSVQPSFVSAIISWATETPSKSQIEYGPYRGYGRVSPLDHVMTTLHSAELTGLQPATQYHFRALNWDSSGRLSNSEDLTFVTSGILPLFAALGQADIQRAPAVWARLAPASFRGLLNSTTGSAYLAPANRFWWDPSTAQFAFGTRGNVPAAAVRGAVNAFNAAHGDELAAVAVATAEGHIPVSQFHAAMERGIKNAQIVNAAVGAGGVEALRQTDVDRISENVGFQLGRLEHFTVQLDSGMPIKTAGSRAAAYAKSAISAFDYFGKRAAAIAGYTQERNILGLAEHCFWNRPGVPQPRPDCPGLTRQGWFKLGEMPLIGTRLCLWSCRCRVVFGR